jgi:hypothetical protein
MRYQGKRPSHVAIFVTIIATASCAPPSPVKWEEIVSPPGGIDGRPLLSLIGTEASTSAAPAPEGEFPQPVCPQSIRVATDGAGGRYAAWWAPRADSSVVLVVARRSAGDGAWNAPVIADARDRGHGGCNRPAPAIAADAARKYVHLAYHLDAPTGAGVYGGHSMESGTYFHDPVAIVYGDRPVATSIATSGEVVAVAYVDPNSARPRIALALSHTAGHLYEDRIDVSPSSMRATDPRVAIDGQRIAVAWTAEEWEAGAQGSRTMLRMGTLTGPAATREGGRGQ